MSTVYEATISSPYAKKDFTSEAAARAAVEASGSGSVTKFRVTPNRPGCLPAEVFNSCALNVYEDGAWRGVNIFGG